MIPIEALNLALGGGRSHSKTVTLKIPAAESIAMNLQAVSKQLLDTGTFDKLDIHDLLGKDRVHLETSAYKYVNLSFRKPYDRPKSKFSSEEKEYCRGLIDEHEWRRLKPEFRSGLSLVGDDGKRTVFLRVVTEVYYARAIDIGVQTTEAQGASLYVNTANVGNTTSSTTSTQSDGSTTSVPDGSSNINSAIQTANALTTQLQRSKSDTVPGGRIQFVNVSETSIGLRRIWERPVAIGFRGIVLRIDIDTGLVLSIAPVHSAASK